MVLSKADPFVANLKAVRSPNGHCRASRSC
jgi:hypothetical protein